MTRSTMLASAPLERNDAAIAFAQAAAAENALSSNDPGNVTAPSFPRESHAIGEPSTMATWAPADRDGRPPFDGHGRLAP